jgi:hypothetical protein
LSTGIEAAAAGDAQARQAEHVFVVGLPRTGSTLTRAILNHSSLVQLAGETHFLTTPVRMGLGRRRGYAERIGARGALVSEDGLQRVVSTIFGAKGKSFWARMADTVDRGAFEAMLRASDRSERALFETVMRQFAGPRPVSGDKSPEHILVVPTLLAWFPNARVIHTFRDPRAIYVSLRRKEREERLGTAARLARRTGFIFEIYASTSVSIQWRRVAALHRRYAAAYPGRYRMLRFEELLADPERATRELCAFIGVPFEAGMLDQVVHNSSYTPKRTGSGIDGAAADRWRDHLSPLARRWISALCGRAMKEFGYDQ